LFHGLGLGLGLCVKQKRDSINSSYENNILINAISKPDHVLMPRDVYL